MGKKRHSKKNLKKPHYTPIASHKKSGSKLITPLSELGMRIIDWPRDLLPEHLWIASLAEHFEFSIFHEPYNAFMDSIDPYMPEDFVALGLISDFGFVPEDKREIFLKENASLVEKVFYRPIGRMLAFYPESPANWLIQKDLIERDGSLDPESELGKMRSLVLKLMPGKDKFAGRVRAVPLNRLLKHNKIFYFNNLPVVELLPKYPIGLNEDEQYHVESVARSDINMVISQRKVPEPYKWAQYFWRHNYDLVPCRPLEAQIVGAVPVSKEQGEQFQEILGHNSASARGYLDVLRIRLRPDMYDPTRDEILFGLFTRLTRLYCLLSEDPYLWARDISGIMLRCLADTAITFAYLLNKGTKEDYKNFIQYGEGQQKLLMLHLQDTYPDEKSLEGLSSEELSDECDFFPELLDIELGHWTKKNTRLLAIEAGMEHLYRLVYSPTSSDLHGSWLSLKNSNLTRCGEPLHRYHRIPSFSEPPFFVNTAIAAQELYEYCRELAIKILGYPEAPISLRKISTS